MILCCLHDIFILFIFPTTFIYFPKIIIISTVHFPTVFMKPELPGGISSKYNISVRTITVKLQITNPSFRQEIASVLIYNYTSEDNRQLSHNDDHNTSSSSVSTSAHQGRVVCTTDHQGIWCVSATDHQGIWRVSATNHQGIWCVSATVHQEISCGGHFISCPGQVYFWWVWRQWWLGAGPTPWGSRGGWTPGPLAVGPGGWHTPPHLQRHNSCQWLMKVRVTATKFNFYHLILRSYNYNMHVEGLLPDNCYLVTLLSLE